MVENNDPPKNYSGLLVRNNSGEFVLVDWRTIREQKPEDGPILLVMKPSVDDPLHDCLLSLVDSPVEIVLSQQNGNTNLRIMKDKDSSKEMVGEFANLRSKS